MKTWVRNNYYSGTYSHKGKEENSSKKKLTLKDYEKFINIQKPLYVGESKQLTRSIKMRSYKINNWILPWKYKQTLVLSSIL